MKNKGFISVFIIYAVALVLGTSTRTVHATTNNLDGMSYSLSSRTTTSETLASIETQNIQLASEAVKVAHPEIVKSGAKSFKYKLPNRENLQIEQSVESYIVYTYLSTYHCLNLNCLQRLNV